MEAAIGQQVTEGLERSCKGEERVRSIHAAGRPGFEFMEARFFGDVFEPHRHDTYAIGLTLGGVQRFRYRGEERQSLPGDILVLHPDEEHDGGAGNEAALHYCMLYVPPDLLAPALTGRGRALPFVRDPVFHDPALRGKIRACFSEIESPDADGLLLDDLLVDVAEGLASHAGGLLPPPRSQPLRQVRAACAFMEAHLARNIHSTELEAITGIDRFALSRAFRAVLHTSPHRYFLMRRLDRARLLLRHGTPLAEAAAETGFADQAHFSRHFKKAYGLTPGRWNALLSRSQQ